MTQPTKREQLAAMRLEDFKAHLRMIAGEDPKGEIRGAPRPTAESVAGAPSQEVSKAKEALNDARVSD